MLLLLVVKQRGETEFCQPSPVRTTGLEPFFVGMRKYLEVGFRMCLPGKTAEPCLSFFSPKKKRGSGSSLCLSVCPMYVVAQGQHTSPDQVSQALYVIYVLVGWIIGRRHKATGTLRGDCYMFYTGYCGNALGESEPIRILNQPNELIPISTARPNKTVYSTAGLASTETLLMIERQEFCNGLG